MNVALPELSLGSIYYSGRLSAKSEIQSLHYVLLLLVTQKCSTATTVIVLRRGRQFIQSDFRIMFFLVFFYFIFFLIFHFLIPGSLRFYDSLYSYHPLYYQPLYYPLHIKECMGVSAHLIQLFFSVVIVPGLDLLVLYPLLFL